MSLETVREVIDKLGGAGAAAELADVGPKTVSAWQGWMGKFPSNTYLLFKRELRRRGHLDDDEELPASLWGMKVRRPAKRGPRGSQ